MIAFVQSQSLWALRPSYGVASAQLQRLTQAVRDSIFRHRLRRTYVFITDFNIHGGTISVSEVLYNWENIVSNASTRTNGFIVLEHDLFQQTVEVATGYILPDALAHQFIIKPVVECLNLPMSDAYIELNNNSTNPPVIEEPGAVTLTATDRRAHV